MVWPCDGCGPYYKRAEAVRCRCAHGGCTAHLLSLLLEECHLRDAGLLRGKESSEGADVGAEGQAQKMPARATLM